MYQNKTTIDDTAVANGGSSFVSTYYWSSIESAIYDYDAWIQNFSDGNQLFSNKSGLREVRSVRAF